MAAASADVNVCHAQGCKGQASVRSQVILGGADGLQPITLRLTTAQQGQLGMAPDAEDVVLVSPCGTPFPMLLERQKRSVSFGTGLKSWQWHGRGAASQAKCEHGKFVLQRHTERAGVVLVTFDELVDCQCS